MNYIFVLPKFYLILAFSHSFFRFVFFCRVSIVPLVFASLVLVIGWIELNNPMPRPHHPQWSFLSLLGHYRYRSRSEAVLSVSVLYSLCVVPLSPFPSLHLPLMISPLRVCSPSGSIRRGEARCGFYMRGLFLFDVWLVVASPLSSSLVLFTISCRILIDWLFLFCESNQ